MKRIAWYLFTLDDYLRQKNVARYAFSIAHGRYSSIDPWGIFEAAEPINSTYVSKFVPEKVTPRTESFEDLFLHATWRGVDTAIEHDKKIVVSYSGGTDSLAVFTALMLHPKYQELSNNGQVEVKMTSTSISEQPEFFSKYIDGKLKYTLLDYNRRKPEEHSVLFSGDFADIVCSTSFIVPIVAKLGNQAVLGDVSYARSYYLSVDPSGKLLSILDSIVGKCPFKITTSLQYAWWVDISTEVPEETYFQTLFTKNPFELEKLTSKKYFFSPFWEPEIVGYGYRRFEELDSIYEMNDLKAEIRKFSFKHTQIEPVLYKIKLPSVSVIPRKVQKYIIFDDDTFVTDFKQAEEYYASLA